MRARLDLTASPSAVTRSSGSTSPDHDCLCERGVAGHVGLTFLAADYEQPLAIGSFDAAIIYDALHHAEDEAAVIRNVFHVLKRGGLFITAEPGSGHAQAPYSIEAAQRFGTTEKDMEYERQCKHMIAAGYSVVRHYIRVSELQTFDLVADAGAKQRVHLDSLFINTLQSGTSSIVVAVK